MRPPRPGRRVDVTLLRKNGRTFRILATRTMTLTAASPFTTRFARPARGTCLIRARFPGDRSHLASQLTRAFAC